MKMTANLHTMNPFQKLFDVHKAHFATPHEAIERNFKTARQEYVFEMLALLGEVEYQKSQLG